MKTRLLMFGLSALLLGVLSIRAEEPEITAIDDIQPGMTVTVRGEVVRITDEDEFRIRDESGSLLIYIGWRNRVMVKVGETVTVSGFVDNDLVNRIRPELYADTIVREDGEVIELHRR